ncbi:MAG: DUF6382 domain-containing protein [Clostridia bacterium]
MNNDSERSFEYSFAADSCSSYLVLKFNNDIKLLNHQVEIISQNPSSAFVPFHIRREDENVSIYYNITSKISLSQYLERKQLNKKELLDLLRSITKSLMLHSNYLLDLSNFVIDEDFIYINPATAEASLVYVPTPSDMDAIEVYKSFLKDLLVTSASVDDNAKDNYLQRILNYLKSEAFSLGNFNKLIIDLRNSGGLNDPIHKSIHVNRGKSVNKETAAAGYVPSSRSLKSEAYGKTAENKHILRIVLLQLLIILAAAIACLFLISQDMGDLVSISGILIIAAAMDILIMKRIAGKQGEQVRADETDRNNEIKRKEHSANKDKHQVISKTADVLRACDTIMISESAWSNHPYLESVGAHAGERVIINKYKFVIGRLGSMVDYIVPGSTVGKLHAEITVNEGIYSIRDLNSKNGTYLNDVRISSNKECEIKNNDRIRFSDFEYIFRQQKVL